MGELFKAFGQSKIPSLLLVLMIYSAGITLLWIAVKSSNNQVMFYFGGGTLLLASIIAVINFVDYRYKEHTETLLRYYKNALEDISFTHSKFEESSRNTLSTGTNATDVGHTNEYSTQPLHGTE